MESSNQLPSPRPLSKVENRRRYLLDKCLMTVEQYQSEIHERRSQNPPVARSAKKIPVPLLADETLDEYRRKFEQWMDYKGQDLAAMREDPSRERNFWFAFAFHRAETKKRGVNEGGCLSQLSSKRHRQDASSSTCTSCERPNHEAGRLEQGTTGSALSTSVDSPTQLVEPKSRSELLAQRVVTTETYFKEHLHRGQNTECGSGQSLSKILVPLNSGETIHDYEREFSLWAMQHTESLESLHSKPVKERRLRCAFARQKAAAATSSGYSRYSPLEAQNAHPYVASPDLTADCSRFLTSGCGTTGDSIGLGSKHAVRHGGEYCMKNVPDYIMANGLSVDEPSQVCEGLPNSLDVNASSKDHHTAKASRPCSSGMLDKRTQNPLSEELRSSEKRVLEFEAKAVQQQKELPTYQPNPRRIRSVPRDEGFCKHEAQTSDKDSEMDSKTYDPVELQNASNGFHLVNHGSSIFFHVKDDQENWPLTKAYSESNNVTIMNETAIADAQAYMKSPKHTDTVQTEEDNNQIIELMAAVDQEKKRRDAALAAVIVYTWAGTQEYLFSFLNKELSEEKRLGAKHEKWAVINSQLTEKNRYLALLEDQLQAQLRLIGTLPPSSTGAGKLLRYKKLRDLSAKWTQEQAAKVILTNDRQELLMCFLQGDNEIRKLVRELLTKIGRQK